MIFNVEEQPCKISPSLSLSLFVAITLLFSSTQNDDFNLRAKPYTSRYLNSNILQCKVFFKLLFDNKSFY